MSGPLANCFEAKEESGKTGGNRCAGEKGRRIPSFEKRGRDSGVSKTSFCDAQDVKRAQMEGRGAFFRGDDGGKVCGESETGFVADVHRRCGIEI